MNKIICLAGTLGKTAYSMMQLPFYYLACKIATIKYQLRKNTHIHHDAATMLNLKHQHSVLSC